MKNSNENNAINYKGFTIVPSNKIEGWFMTVEKHPFICGESIGEVQDDIDRTQRAIEYDKKNRLMNSLKDTFKTVYGSY